MRVVVASRAPRNRRPDHLFQVWLPVVRIAPAVFLDQSAGLTLSGAGVLSC